MLTPKSLRISFNMSAIKTKGLTLLIEHAPCCLLSLAAGFIGLSAFNHNPVLELGFALGGAVVGEHIGHKYFAKKHTHKPGWKSQAKRYGLSLLFGLTSWGGHQVAFHDDHDHSAHPTEVQESHQHPCHHDTHNEHPFFGSPALKTQIEASHQHMHPHCLKNKVQLP